MRSSVVTLTASAGQRDLAVIRDSSSKHFHWAVEATVFQPGQLFIDDSLHIHKADGSSQSEIPSLVVDGSVYGYNSDASSIGMGYVDDDFSLDTRSLYQLYEANSGATWSYDAVNKWIEIDANSNSDYITFGQVLSLSSIGYFRVDFTSTDWYNIFSPPADFMLIENDDSSRQLYFNWGGEDEGSGLDAYEGYSIYENGVLIDSYVGPNSLVEEVGGSDYSIEGFWGPNDFSMYINGNLRFAVSTDLIWNDLSRFKYKIHQQSVNITYLYVGPINSDIVGALGIQKSVSGIYSDSSQVITFGDVNAESSVQILKSNSVLLEGVQIDRSRHKVKSEAAVVTYNTSGSGTVNDPYRIYNEVDLNQIQTEPTANFIFKDNIKMTQTWEPFWFAGEIDGNRQTLDLTGLIFEGDRQSGFFSVNIGDIKTLGIIGGTFRSENGADSYKGALAGENRGSIYHCYARDGLVETEGGQAGGLIGYNNGDISQCYAAQEFVGDIVSPSANVGGVVGWNAGTGDFNFFDQETWSSSSSGGFNETYGSELGTAKTTVEMQTAATYIDWDFKPWTTYSDTDYPSFVAALIPDNLHAHTASEVGVTENISITVESSRHDRHWSDNVVFLTGVLFNASMNDSQQNQRVDSCTLYRSLEYVSHSGGDDATVAYPTGIEVGDLILLFASTYNATSHGPTDTGWTQVYSVDMSSSDYASLWYRRALGTESGNSFNAVASSSIEYLCIALRGVGNPTSYAQESAGTLTTPSVSVESLDRLLGVVHGWFSSNYDLTAPSFYDVFEVERWSSNEGAIVAGTTAMTTGIDPGHTFTDAGNATYNKPFAIVLGTGLWSSGALMDIESSSAAHSSDAVSLTEYALITPTKSVHALSSDEAIITNAIDVAVLDSVHEYSSDAITVIENAIISLQDTVHGHASDEAIITNAIDVAVLDSAHEHGTDELSLIEHASVQVEGSIQSHASDSATVSEFDTVLVEDSIHNNASDEANLTEQAIVSIEDSLHNHTSDETSVDTFYSVVVESSLHNHISDSSILTEAASVGVADSTHGHTSDELAISANYQTAVDDSTHIHNSDEATVDENAVVSVENALHGHNSDSATVSEFDTVLVESSRHAHTADSAQAIENASITAHNTTHDHKSDEPVASSDYIDENLGIPVDSNSGGQQVDNNIGGAAIDANTSTRQIDDNLGFPVVDSNSGGQQVDNNIGGAAIDANTSTRRQAIDGNA